MPFEKHTPTHIPFTDLYTSNHYEFVLVSDGINTIRVEDCEIPFLVERLQKLHCNGELIDLGIWGDEDAEDE